jgi:hypothetical protein
MKSPLLVKNSPNSKNQQNESDSREIWGQSHQPKKHRNLIRDTHQKPQEVVLKTPPTKSSENQHKRARENHLEEQRRTIYTYHEGSYKVKLATQTSILLSRSHMKLKLVLGKN